MAHAQNDSRSKLSYCLFFILFEIKRNIYRSLIQEMMIREMELEISDQERTFLQWEDTVPGVCFFIAKKSCQVFVVEFKDTVPGVNC